MTDAYVIGTTLPALAAALELAEVGLSVRVALNESAAAGSELDPNGELDPDGDLAAFLTHLAQPIGERGTANPGATPVARDPHPVQLRDAKGGWALQPMPAVWGVPAVPMAAAALAILGGGAATRASLDRIKPVLTIGKTHELGVLVRNRMGKVVEQRLVDPLVRERYGVASDSVEVALAAPGLNEALTRAGSLSGAALAYSERFVARETRVVPAEGWAALVAGLVERLKLYGVEFSELPLESVVAEAADGWRVSELGGQTFTARAVVVDPAVALSGPLAGVIDQLALFAPEAWRQQVSVRVEVPGELVRDHAALETIQLEGSVFWSVRLEHCADSGWWAHLVGPRTMTQPADVRDGSDAKQAVLRVLELAGLTAVSEIEVSVRVASYVSAASRDAEVAQLLEQREADFSLLAVGGALHGGDPAMAVADSRAAAVLLRRKLTGIAE